MSYRSMHTSRTVLGHVLSRNPELWPDTWIGKREMPNGAYRMFTFRKSFLPNSGRNEWVVNQNGKGMSTYFPTLKHAVAWHLR